MTAFANITAMQRSRGEAAVCLVSDGAKLRIAGLRQQGSGKVILPTALRNDQAEIVFLNTSGGLAGGDRLSLRVDLGADVRALATTQTAERAYRVSNPTEGPAEVRVDLTVGPGGWIDWLPQETILFDRSRLQRRSQIDLAAGAGCLMLESIVLGRAAMGEVLREVELCDWREVRQEGRPILIEPVRLNQAALHSGLAGLNNLRAFASLALIRPDAADWLERLRPILDEPGVTAAASALPGRLLVRIMAADGWPMRRQIARCLRLLRAGASLPRVWQM